MKEPATTTLRLSMTPNGSDESAIQLGITSAAISADAGALYRIASSLMDEGVAFDSLLFDYLLPAERAVGHRWEQGDYLISEEHAATAAIETVISLLVGMFDQPEEAPHVVIAAAQGDDHSLPGRAVSAHLLFTGYRITFLGANVLATDLAEFLEAEGPDVLVLSCTMSSHLVGAHSSITAAKEAGVPVVVGGRAFGDDDARARRLGADAWSATLSGVLAEVERLIEQGSVGGNAGPAPAGDRDPSRRRDRRPRRRPPSSPGEGRRQDRSALARRDLDPVGCSAGGHAHRRRRRPGRDTPMAAGDHGHARVSGRPGVRIVARGPGGTIPGHRHDPREESPGPLTTPARAWGPGRSNVTSRTRVGRGSNL